MTLIKRVVAEKRVPLTVVGISLAAAVGLYALGVYPSTIRVSQAREREVAAAARLAVAQQALETARGTAEGKTQVDADLEQFYGGIEAAAYMMEELGRAQSTAAGARSGGAPGRKAAKSGR